jgi:selenocysteine lyase/cysteine desulfurase
LKFGVSRAALPGRVSNGAIEVLPHRQETIVSCAPTVPVASSSAPVSRDAFVGIDQLVPLFDGSMAPFVNLDNAASTPAFRSVVEAIDEFLPFYAGVHRGTGYKSRLSTNTFERARELIGGFFGADPERDVVVFVKNTTEAINKLAGSLPIDNGSVVLTTLLEHHSNDLPWRGRARTVHVGALPDGTLDLDDLHRLLGEHAGRIALLAVSGASNVTGVVQPVHLLAEMVHSVGGRILVDAAQLAPHRPIDMRPHDDAGHLDFVACSAHKMYAPFGTGALVGARCAFGPAPDQTGGGTVHAVTTDEIVWADLPDREEAGSPNVIGSIALAVATRTLTEIGLDRIAAHEIELTRYATQRLSRIPGLTIHGPAEGAGSAAKLGVIPFTIAGIDHGLIAAVLGYEHGVGVRSGCFCAHPYIGHLLRIDGTESRHWVDRARDGDKRGAPGMVRISFGCYNDSSDVDVAVAALEHLVAGEVAAVYGSDRDGSYHPVGYVEPTMFSLVER